MQQNTDPQVTQNSTSLSCTSSSASSRRNSSDDVHYPPEYHKVVVKRKIKSVRGSRKFDKGFDKGFGSVTEEPLEKDEAEKKQTLPHVKMINDYQEFSQKISWNSLDRKKRTTNNNVYRRRSCTPTNRGLPRVEEESNKEEDELRNQFVFKLGLMLDKNEFNRKRSSSIFFRRQDIKEIYDNKPIIEDMGENIKDNSVLQQQHGSLHKLIVDEVDDMNVQEKKWNLEETLEQTETIHEEKAEDDFSEFTSREQKILNKAKHFRTEQLDYVKRILKGELITPEDNIKYQQFIECGDYDWKSLIYEAGSSISGDSDD